MDAVTHRNSTTVKGSSPGSQHACVGLIANMHSSGSLPLLQHALQACKIAVHIPGPCMTPLGSLSHICSSLHCQFGHSAKHRAGALTSEEVQHGVNARGCAL